MPTAAEVRGWARLVGGVAGGPVVTTVQDMHRVISRGAYRWLGPVGRPIERVTDTVADGVYAGVRVGLRGLGELSGAVVGSRLRQRVTPRSEKARAIAIGALDARYVALAPELDHPMVLRHDGEDVPICSSDLTAVYPQAGPRIVVFVHGLVDTENVWQRVPRSDIGGLPDIARAAGTTPVLVRYPTGREIARNGADLDALLESLVRRWPVPVDELTLVGHSMGGLVIRAASIRAAGRGARWPGSVRDVFYLGTPHQGSWLEKAANVGSAALRHASSRSAPLGSLLDGRARGIKDLRFGRVADDDTDPETIDDLLAGRHPPVAWAAGMTHHLVVGRLHQAARNPANLVFGDGLVRAASASARDTVVGVDAERIRVVSVAARHTHLTDHPEVGRLLRDALHREVADEPRARGRTPR